MTIEEAIRFQEAYYVMTNGEKAREACKIAIYALEKQIPKECDIDSCPDHTHYKCPSCGKIHLSRYKHGCPSLGRIPKYCEYCGQALRMESDSAD